MTAGLIAKDDGPSYTDYINQLKNQPGTEFDQVNYKEYLGDRADVLILGENGKVVFNSFKTGVNKKVNQSDSTSTTGKTDIGNEVYEHWNNPLLPNIGEQRIFDFQWLDSDNLLIETWINNNNQMKDKVSFIINDSGVVVFATGDGEKEKPHGYLKVGDKLSEEQFRFISYLANDNKIIVRENFTNTGGATYTALFFERNETTIDSKFVTDLLIIIIASYLIIVILVTVIIYTMVKRPLKILDKAMGQVEKGDFSTRAMYRGTYEFENIITHFNGMVKQLWLLQRKNRKLEKEKRELLAHISHDLKTPLTTIEGYVNAVCDGLIPVEELPKIGEIIKERVHYTNDLINAFHDYAKLDHPDMVYRFKVLNCCYVLRQYFADRYTELEDKGYHLDVDIPDEPIYMRIDQKKFERVIGNLIDNSVKYNPKGTKIYCKVYVEGRNIHILIGDNGVGISNDVQDELFKPFVTSDKARQNSSGLGLAFVKKIVDVHGGSIKVNQNSKLGITTEFELEFISVVE